MLWRYAASRLYCASSWRFSVEKRVISNREHSRVFEFSYTGEGYLEDHQNQDLAQSFLSKTLLVGQLFPHRSVCRSLAAWVLGCVGHRTRLSCIPASHNTFDSGFRQRVARAQPWAAFQSSMLRKRKCRAVQRCVLRRATVGYLQYSLDRFEPRQVCSRCTAPIDPALLPSCYKSLCISLSISKAE